MKHKAQGSLDYLVMVSCPKQTSCKECNISHRCNSLAKDYVDDIQKSIDCQLTYGEITTLLHVYKRYSEERNMSFPEDSVRKLNKQKEMWEVE